MGIPVCVPVIPKNAKKYVNEVIDRNWVSSLCLDDEVNYIKKLEEGFAAFIGAKHATTVTSGSTALDLAMATLKIGLGDEVIVPTFTMVATANAVIHAGAKPVFVDVDPNTWCIDASKIEAAITERTKAIVPVHIYGYPADMNAIMRISLTRELYVIEDAAEAIGTFSRGKHAGTIGDIGIFSFYANKTMTSGEGGMLIAHNHQFANRAAMLKDQAFGTPRFIHSDIGFNFRMNNLTAAYAYASFEEVESYIVKRKRNAQLYRKALMGVPGITLPPESSPDAINSYWMFGILVNEEFGRSKADLQFKLKNDYKIDTRDFFYPMHKQPVMIDRGFSTEETCFPVAERLWETGLYLPSSTNLTEEEITYITEAIKTLGR